MALKIYLIRHGETEFNKQGKEWGQPNEMPLNDWGFEQCKKLAQKLSKIKFDKLFSSDIKRAMQTAEVVSKTIGLPINEDKRLGEYNPGEVDPSSEKWIEEYKKLLNSGMSKYDIRPFGGENIWDLIKRVKSFLEDIQKEEGTIIVIAHSGVNAAFMNLSRGREKNDFVSIKQDSTCINVLEYEDGKWNILAVNDSSHISDLIPEIIVYNNQEKIKEKAKGYVLEKLDDCCNKIIFNGDIVVGKIGYYNRPYKRYNGSTIEVFADLKENFEIPKEWKISEINDEIKKYEIGNIKIESIKHKVNVTFPSKRINAVSYSEVIK